MRAPLLRVLWLVTAAVCGGAPGLVHAQGAPLVDGLGGPHGVGEPVPPIAFDIEAAFPDGMTLYGAEGYRTLWPNIAPTVSFGDADCCYDGLRLPDPTPDPGVDAIMVVFDVRSADIRERQLDDPLWAIYGHVDPAIEPDIPGRVVITWLGLSDRQPEHDLARFVDVQIVLTPAGGQDFDVELRYHRCEWSAPWYAPHDYAVMGFDAQEGADGPGWMWPGSLTAETENLCQLSNVREPGVFRYQVRDGLPRGCGIGLEPPPGEGRCADGNHRPGDGCSPACYVEPDVDGDGVYEAPSPDSIDLEGVYDDCFDPVEMQCIALDGDNDRVPDPVDNCPDDKNFDQADYDDDGVGDACQRDADGDDLDSPVDELDPDSHLDNCPQLYNPGTRLVDPDGNFTPQSVDADHDDMGDPCDPDDDNDGWLDCGDDGICNPLDNGYDDDRDALVDEAGECQPGDRGRLDCDRGDRDLFDNDSDGLVDELTEAGLPRVDYVAADPGEDNCRVIANPDQADQDGDGIGDVCDGDVDGDRVDECDSIDGICGPDADHRDNDGDGVVDEAGECLDACARDADHDLIDQDQDGFVDEGFEPAALVRVPLPVDVCPGIFDPDQRDTNGDGLGDLCADDDGDELIGAEDNCIDVSNPEQDDLDEDGIGDACDDDLDGDRVDNPDDNCPVDRNRDQLDTDGDLEGDACDIDDDGDGIADVVDNCPLIRDPIALDTDEDGQGDACDDDDDGDGVPDETDLCPLAADPDQDDLDEDGEGDACDADDDGDRVDDADDNCPRLVNPSQHDEDDDGLGDACDPDDDGDGIADAVDLCPFVADPMQGDVDGDGLGDACDDDIDDDRVPNAEDVCPSVPDPRQADLDGDRIGDACDDDDDDDGIADGVDVCPLLADDQRDTDGDGLGDACDPDDDGDGVDDTVDVCPITADEGQADRDGDGIGDACDPTDDRPFDALNPEERCAALVARGAPTLERLRHCPPAVDGGGCDVGGSESGAPWWAGLLLLGVLRRRRRV